MYVRLSRSQAGQGAVVCFEVPYDPIPNTEDDGAATQVLAYVHECICTLYVSVADSEDVADNDHHHVYTGE